MNEAELNAHYGDNRRDTKEYWERVAKGAIERWKNSQARVEVLEERILELNRQLTTDELNMEFDNVNKR